MNNKITNRHLLHLCAAMTVFATLLIGASLHNEYSKYFALAFILLIIYLEIAGASENAGINSPRFSNVGIEGLIGKTAEVMKECLPVGKVRINNEIWNAKSNNSEPIKVGEQVIIKDVKGLELLVEKLY